MNNLIEFIKKNFHYFLFAVLLVLSLTMIGKSMAYSNYKFARICQSITGPIQKNWSDMVHKFSLGQENEELVQQNIALMREHDNMFIVREDTLITQMSEEDSLHTTRTRMFDYTHAHIIYRTTDQAYNYLIVDKGAKDGITRDMAVTSPSGVVGVVGDVSDNFAAVIPILHPDSRISAVVSSVNQVGTVVWEGNDCRVAYLENIPQHLEINIGDSVVTSGYSNIFPKGLLVGTVKEVSMGNNASFLTIKIKLATNFNKVNTVYLIENQYKSEIDSLKAGFKTE
ncbi:MAG: rod shape-determining protein MreC [Bacteroidales bacterium]|nr:rod shape-determining protein MreC [Bacteroidales bacterium]